jgi:hypothetical protein
VGDPSAEREQVADALHAVHDQGFHPRTRRDGGRARRRARSRGGERKQDAGRREARERGPGEPWPPRPKESRDEDGREHGGEARADDARVEALERLHVRDEPAHEVAAAVRLEPRGGEGNEGPVDEDAQARKEAERDVVGDEPVEIAQQPAARAEEAHAHDRDLQRAERRVERRARDEIRGRGHEADAAAERREAEERRGKGRRALGPGEAEETARLRPHDAPS